MTETLIPTRPAVRTTGPSLPALVRLEIRKSLSTRSGRSVAVASAGLVPAAAAVLASGGDELDAVVGPMAGFGMVTALLLLALGVLATATEWTHRTAETTFLLVPSRGRVLAAKAGAVAVLGAGLAGIAVAASSAVLSVAPIGDPSWAGVPYAMAVSVAAGAAFAVIGAGTGAALGNTPAALTGLYLVVLGVMPALQLFRPEIATALDPASATMTLAVGGGATGPVLTLAGWLVVATVAGVALTRRRPVS